MNQKIPYSGPCMICMEPAKCEKQDECNFNRMARLESAKRRAAREHKPKDDRNR